MQSKLTGQMKDHRKRGGAFLRQLNSLSKKTEKIFQDLGKDILNALKPPAGPYAIFYHQAYIITRIRDLRRILKRMNQYSRADIKLNYKLDKIVPSIYPAGKKFPSNVCRVLGRSDELTQYMRLDFESLFIFGNILLDQWAIFIAYLMNWKHPEEYDFLQLVVRMDGEGKKGNLYKLWSSMENRMLWLIIHVRAYRNVNIVHLNKPLQLGTTRASYYDEFKLFTPSPPGWYNDVKKKSKSIGNKIKMLSSQAEESTHDYKMIGMEILEFIFSAIKIILEDFKNDFSKVNLGKPYLDQ